MRITPSCILPGEYQTSYVGIVVVVGSSEKPCHVFGYIKLRKERTVKIQLAATILGTRSEIETEHGEKKNCYIWKMIYFVRVIIFDDANEETKIYGKRRGSREVRRRAHNFEQTFS